MRYDDIKQVNLLNHTITPKLTELASLDTGFLYYYICFSLLLSRLNHSLTWPILRKKKTSQLLLWRWKKRFVLKNIMYFYYQKRLCVWFATKKNLYIFVVHWQLVLPMSQRFPYKKNNLFRRPSTARTIFLSVKIF
jgi:hypothetical protein